MSGAQGGQSGGLGGSIHANMYFVPGSVLYLYVGGEGGDSYGFAGYNGGGEGQYNTGGTISGGGGGGSSDIRTSLAGCRRAAWGCRGRRRRRLSK